MTCIQEVRPAFEWLYRKPALSQPGHNRQRNSRFPHTTRSAGYQ
jgi:hypothetical protein